MSPPKAICGLDLPTIKNVKADLSIATENGFNFVRGPMVNQRNYRDPTDPNYSSQNAAFTRSDLILTSCDWSSMFLGRISDWIDCDSPNEAIVSRSESVLNQELSFCNHLGLFATSLSIHGLNHINLARILYNKVVKSYIPESLEIWVHVPMITPISQGACHRKDVEESSFESGWPWWRKFHALCNNIKSIGLLLEVTADLPSSEELDRWVGEPIRALLINTSVFLTNRKGYPVLSQAHQAFVRRTSLVCKRVIITGVNRHAEFKHYVKYINYLFEMREPQMSMMPFSRGYEDYLQVPLQPLMDNLESSVYEVFEKDPIKYTEYQRAINMVLTDRTVNMQDRQQVVIVVGAGRGPLVNAAIAAAEMAHVKIKLYVVEKNPNAFVTLCSLKEEIWKDKVELFLTDMRKWEAPVKADILVSELLGSFGDNELSPECLDEAQKFLKDDGISIPCSYTSYLKPIQSVKLFNEVHGFRPHDKPQRTTYESPYVVHLVNSYSIAAEQPVFTFYHPNKGESNSRHKELRFDVTQDCVLHGFGGYFDAVLYKDVILSIRPCNMSRGMFSWFPMYFPIQYPMRLMAGDTLVVHMWRQSDSKQVWYEWSVSEPQELPIHNPNGRSYFIGLQ